MNNRMGPVLFMHVPKTSGTALMVAIEAALAPSRVVHGFDRSLFGSFDGFEDLAPHISRTVFRSPADLPADPDLVTGHFAYSTLRTSYPGGRLLTVLREPLTRLLSHWLFWRRISDADLSGWAGWTAYVRKARGTLRDFLMDREVAAQTDNLMTRLLLWPHPLLGDADFIHPRHDEHLLHEASHRLGEFGFVDIAENPALPARLANWLDRKLVMSRHNETLGMPVELRSPLRDEFTPHALDLLAERSRLDLPLWCEVARRVTQDVDHLRATALLASAARHGAVMAA